VNDYLPVVTSEWNGTLFEWLGITVDCIDKHQPNSEDRRKSLCSRYCLRYLIMNSGLIFKRQHGALHRRNGERKHHYAMVDEVDSVLIDDARTPLIISGPVGKDDTTQQFF